MNKSFATIPIDLNDKDQVRRYFIFLQQKIDELYNNRGKNPNEGSFSYLQDEINNNKSDISNNRASISGIKDELSSFSKLDGSRDYIDQVHYDSSVNITDDLSLVSKKYVDDNFTNNPQQTNIAKLNQDKVTRGSSYDQNEAQQVADNVKAIADKVDNIIDALINSNILQ